MPEELLEIVNEKGKVIGIVSRSEVHGNPLLLHKVVHIFVFNDKGEVLLQKRSIKKDVAPGKWDTSVGGHVEFDENILIAATREMEEELGVSSHKIKFLYSYIHSNSYESELVYTYSCKHNGPFVFNKDEIEKVKFWDLSDIQKNIGTGIFSSNFEDEIMKYLKTI